MHKINISTKNPRLGLQHRGKCAIISRKLLRCLRSPDRWQPLLQPSGKSHTSTSLMSMALSVPQRWRQHATPRASSEEAACVNQHPDLGLGLYGIPGLTHPEGFFQLCEEAEAACAQLLQQIVALDVMGTRSRGDTQDLVANVDTHLEAKLDRLVAAYEFALAGCKLPAAHCREHHEAPEWRLAARLAEDEQLQPLSEALYHVLARHSVWGSLQQRRLGASSGGNSRSSSSTVEGPQGCQQGTSGLGASSSTAAGAQGLQQHTSVLEQQPLEPQQQEPGSEHLLRQKKEQRPRKELQQIWQLQENAVSASTLLGQQEQQDLKSLEAIEEELKEVAELVLMEAEGPVLVLDWRSEVHGDGLLAQLCHPLPDSLTEGQHQQQQRAGGSDADSRAGCSLACVLDALQEEQQAMRAEQSYAGGLLGVGGMHAGQLPTGEALTLWHAAYCSPKAVLQVQQWQMARGGSGPPPQLAALPLSPRLSSALVATHPSPAMRRLAYQAGVAPRVDAFWGVLDALRSVRDAISAFQGFPSPAHRAWVDTSARSPAAVASFLKDMAAALQPMAEAEAEHLRAWLPAAVSSLAPRAEQQHKQQQQQEQAARATSKSRPEKQQWSVPGPEIHPWDLEFAQEAAASHAQARGTSTVMPPWSSLAHLFPLQVSLSTGLSRILAPAGLRVTVASCPPNGGSSDSNESASEHSTSKRSTSMYNTSKHSTSGQPQNRDGAAAVMTEGGRGGVGQWLEMGEGWMGSSSPCLKLLLFDTKPVSKGRQASGRQSTGHTKDGPAQRAGGDAIAEVEIQGQLESGGRGAMDAQGAVPAGESSVGKEEGEGECDADGSVGGRLLGVIYCSCDPECGMPFARLIRPGTGAHSATLSAVGLHRLTIPSHGNSLPHVAIHIPAESLYLAPSNTAGHKHHEQQQQQQEQQPALLMKSPALLKLVLHEMGHAISMILSAHSAPSSVFGNVGFASTDVQELSAHVLERCACDAHSLVALADGPKPPAGLPSRLRNSSAPTEDGWGVQRLSLSYASQLAEHMKAHSAIDLHQKVLLAISDLQLHSCGAVDTGNSEEARTLLPGTDQNHHSRTSKDVMRGVWHEYGVMGLMGPACTQQVLRLLPRLVHTPALMPAYPMCDILSAAIWKHHGLSTSQHPFPHASPAQTCDQRRHDHDAKSRSSTRTALAAAPNSKWAGEEAHSLVSGKSITEAEACRLALDMPDGRLGALKPGWLAVRKNIFEAGAGADLQSMVVNLLDAQCMQRVPLPQGSAAFQSGGASPSYGAVPDLASDVFQGIDL